MDFLVFLEEAKKYDLRTEQLLSVWEGQSKVTQLNLAVRVLELDNQTSQVGGRNVRENLQMCLPLQNQLTTDAGQEHEAEAPTRGPQNQIVELMEEGFSKQSKFISEQFEQLQNRSSREMLEIQSGIIKIKEEHQVRLTQSEQQISKQSKFISEQFEKLQNQSSREMLEIRSGIIKIKEEHQVRLTQSEQQFSKQIKFISEQFEKLQNRSSREMLEIRSGIIKIKEEHQVRLTQSEQQLHNIMTEFSSFCSKQFEKIETKLNTMEDQNDQKNEHIKDEFQDLGTQMKSLLSKCIETRQKESNSALSNQIQQLSQTIWEIREHIRTVAAGKKLGDEEMCNLKNDIIQRIQSTRLKMPSTMNGVTQEVVDDGDVADSRKKSMMVGSKEDDCSEETELKKCCFDQKEEAADGVPGVCSGSVMENRTDQSGVLVHPGPLSSNQRDVLVSPGPLSSNKRDVLVHPGPLSSHQRVLLVSSGPLSSNQRDIIINPGPMSSNQSDVLVSPSPLSSNQRDVLVNPGPLSSNQRDVLVSIGPLSSNQRDILVHPVPLSSNQRDVLESPAPLSSNQRDVLVNPGPPSSNQRDVLVKPGPLSSNQTDVLVSSGPLSSSQGDVLVNPGPLSSNQRDVLVNQGPLSSNQRDVLVNPGPLISNQRDVLVNPGPLSSNQRDVLVNPGPPSSNQRDVLVKPGPLSSNQRDVLVNTGTLSSNQGDVLVKPGPLILNHNLCPLSSDQTQGTAEKAEKVILRKSIAKVDELLNAQNDIATKETLIEATQLYTFTLKTLRVSKRPNGATTMSLIDSKRPTASECMTLNGKDYQKSNAKTDRNNEVFPGKDKMSITIPSTGTKYSQKEKPNLCGRQRGISIKLSDPMTEPAIHKKRTHQPLIKNVKLPNLNYFPEKGAEFCINGACDFVSNKSWFSTDYIYTQPKTTKVRLKIAFNDEDRIQVRLCVSQSPQEVDCRWPVYFIGAGKIRNHESKKYTPLWKFELQECDRPEPAAELELNATVCLLTSWAHFKNVRYSELTNRKYDSEDQFRFLWTLSAH